MLNTFKIGGNSTTVSFTNSSSGMIQKSHPKSRFIKLHSTSQLADKLFNSEKKSYLGKKYDNDYKEITILQIMVFGENWLMVEIVNDEDLKEEIIE